MYIYIWDIYTYSYLTRQFENDLQVCKIFYVSSSCITPSDTVNFTFGRFARTLSESYDSDESLDW